MTALPRSAPRAQGVDASGIDRFLGAVESHPEVQMHSLMVLRHGTVVAEGWWAPYSADRLHLLYSLSKSFTSAALGLAVAEGLVGLDETVLQHLPHLAGDDVAHDPRLRHLAAMASGHTWDTWDDVLAAGDDDPVRAFLRLAPDDEPGTRFAYNQSCTHTVGAVLQHVTGTTLTEYLRPRLLDPLGVGEVRWNQLPAGRDLGFSGLHGRTEDVARLGLLHLQEGRWGGRQLLDPAWVREATTPQVSTAGEDKVDWTQGYGYQFWGARHGYRGDGAYGQYCVVLPEQDAVVAVTGASHDMQAVLDAMWEHLLPALRDAPLDAAEAIDDALTARMASLGLPPVEGAPAPADEAAWGGTVFTASTGEDGPHGLEQVTVRHRDGGWWLHLDEAGETVVVGLGTGAWVTTEDASSATLVPAAASGGWRPDGLHALLAFVETPHSLRLRLDPQTLTAHATWVTAPLHGTPLAWSAAPRG